MRIRRDDVHAVIWQACDELEAGVLLASVDKSPMMMTHLARHQTAWLKAYWRPIVVGLAAYAAALAASIALAAQLDAKWLVAVAGLGVAVHALACLVAHRRTVTVEELEALLPLLQLSPNGRIYAETLALVYKSPIDDAVKREAIAELKGLMDQDDALGRQWERLSKLGAVADGGEIEADIQRLESLRDSATDPSAKRTYEEGVSLALERKEAAERYRPLIEQIDAEREVVRQAFLRLKDDVVRSMGPTAGWERESLPALRRSVSTVREHAEALERAIEELGKR
jgi:hypothetical protein